MIVFVVGLYKSGTSMIASALEEVGCESIVDRVATTRGLSGVYDIKESYAVNQLNNQILNTYSKGCIYYKNSDLPQVIDSNLQQAIKSFLQSCKGRHVFIKDPRFIGTIKYWLEGMPEEEEYKIVYVDRSIGLKESFQIDKWFEDKIIDKDYNTAIASLKENYIETKTKYAGIEIPFDIFKNKFEQVACILYHYITGGFSKIYKIYFHDYFLHSKELTKYFAKQSPGEYGVWKNIVAVDKVEDSDFEIVQDKTTATYNKKKLIFFGREPKHVYSHDISEAALNFHHEKGNTWLPQTWWLSQNYDELLENNSIDKLKLLSVIDSGKTVYGIQQKRVDVIDKLYASDINVSIYGKTNRYNSEKYKGELPYRDKSAGLLSYRFNLAIENGSTDYYFSEKFCDPVLCNTFPIYYGCRRIEKFFPKGSYFWLDLEGDIVSQVRDITNIPVQELDYNALFEAKDLILNKYNLWNTIFLAINNRKVL